MAHRRAGFGLKLRANACWLGAKLREVRMGPLWLVRVRNASTIRATYRALRDCGYALRFHVAPIMGRKPTYEIAPGYRHRNRASYYDDTENADEWQRDVYEESRRLMFEHQLRSVTDVGCGSGYKLVHQLGEFDTTGVDLPETIEWVRRKYPERRWIGGSFDDVELPTADLVVCADVIEHVLDPDMLMRLLRRVARNRVVISTPDRDLVYRGRTMNRFGPPANPAHVREWTFGEFRNYADRFFEVEKHVISNPEQATQMIVGRIS